MTVISPYQRQLVFTGYGAARNSRKVGVNFLKRVVELVSLTRTLAVLLGVAVFCGFGFLYLAVDSVFLSFEIQALNSQIEEYKMAKERIELRRADLLSPDSLKDFALMVQLENPGSIIYQVKN